ncbi:MAG: lysophospholipid acyltransferase family protein [Candidatus Eisenbacteria bacterium]|nr:lysophospholipid acyltransferase family protein [Candidatus Eisenbacteria bacterium]
MRRKTSHFFVYLLVLGIVKLAQALPHGAALRFGSWLGRFAFSVARMRRRIATDNLRAAFPDHPATELERIARRTYRNLGMSLVEYARLPVTTAEQMAERISVRGFEHFDAALERGKGAVLVTGHFGSWELMGARLKSQGYPVNFLVGEQSNAAVDKLMNDLRKSQGIGIISMGASMRNVLKALKQNQFVAMLSDQDAGSRGVFVDFLGRPASTPFGPASFAVRTGAALICGFMVREGLSRHRVTLEAPLLPVEGAGDEEESLRLTQEYTSLLERYVRDKPDHWLWLHRRWKTRPERVAAARAGRGS